MSASLGQQPFEISARFVFSNAWHLMTFSIGIPTAASLVSLAKIWHLCLTHCDSSWSWGTQDSVVAFTILEPRNPLINEFYALRKHWSTDFEALKLQKCRSGRVQNEPFQENSRKKRPFVLTTFFVCSVFWASILPFDFSPALWANYNMGKPSISQRCTLAKKEMLKKNYSIFILYTTIFFDIWRRLLHPFVWRSLIKSETDIR